MYPDFEDLILQRQEDNELIEDADPDDECSLCPLRMTLTGRLCDMECILWRRQQEDINR